MVYEDRGYSCGPPSTSAVFVGGPVDGLCQILYGRPDQYQFTGFVTDWRSPTVESMMEGFDPLKPVTLTYTYQVTLDATGYPSITDDGLTRYEYVGSY